MKIKFEWTFDIDKSEFPNLTKEQIREHFKSCAQSYMQQVEEETVRVLEDENVSG